MTIPINLCITHIFLFTYHLMDISKLFKDISSILSKGINHFVQGYQPCVLISKPWLGQFVNTNPHLATTYCKLWPNSLYLCIPSLWAYAPHHFVIFKDISKFLRGACTYATLQQVLWHPHLMLVFWCILWPAYQLEQLRWPGLLLQYFSDACEHMQAKCCVTCCSFHMAYAFLDLAPTRN